MISIFCSPKLKHLVIMLFQLEKTITIKRPSE